MSAIERRCLEHGLRMTGQRKVISKVLGEATDHPDVEELYRRASMIDEKISLSTVYRTVRVLEEAKILSRLDFGDGRARYEVSPEEHHDHLIDLNSGKVIEFHDEEIERLQEEIAKRHGYHLVSHRMELFAVPFDPKKHK
jgi:Fur family transcriptional regulator, ferric uptake regulator